MYDSFWNSISLEFIVNVPPETVIVAPSINRNFVLEGKVLFALAVKSPLNSKVTVSEG